MSKNSVKRVVNAIQKFYPISLADKSWDNTGLLVDSSYEEPESSTTQQLKILLTIDLTQSVAQEAINKQCKFIMSYHPFIFRGLKSITQQDPQQRSLIKLIQNNISVYCPHTAVDSANGGVNDYLVKIVTDSENSNSSKPIEPDSNDPKCGMGRIVELQEPRSITKIIGNVKKGLDLRHLQVAISNEGTEKPIKTVAICAGSGSGVFKGVEADLFLTGELSHHEALYLKESGSHVICCNHSNTERGFLKVIQKQLADELDLSEENIIISESDKDPFETW
ncbi:NIF3 [Candida jiufengensis]|uniref:NIF3 n=1 Tax=Candida jiufengensis TaxID=497108 RepID=UPI0022241BA0|nr:NIF3 [Candida jiufengensis]KAI5955049.1 NIF3 [Candida jiufengensis]